MKKLIITNRLHKKLINYKEPNYFLSMKTLSSKEITIAKKYSIMRFNLPELKEEEKLGFYNEFDNCWDTITKHYKSDHPFWRNTISSKMQEWDKSAAYFLLILYTLIRKEIENVGTLIIICSSLEEESFCKTIMEKNRFTVEVKPYYNLPMVFRLSIQRIINLIHFVYFFFLMIRKKIQCSTFNYDNDFDKDSKKTIICSLFYWDTIRNNNYIDSYFGTIHNYLKNNNRHVLYLGAPIDMMKGAVNNVKDVIIKTPYNLISWFEIINISLRLFFRTFNIQKIHFMKTDVSRLLIWNSKRWNNYINFHSEVFYSAVKKLCDLYNIDRVLLLFEGNSFERACIQGFKKGSQNIKIIGYSHAVIFPLNLKLHLTPNEKINRPEPDLFLVPGLELKNLLEEVGKRNPEIIIESCSLRYIPKI